MATLVLQEIKGPISEVMALEYSSYLTDFRLHNPQLS